MKPLTPADIRASFVNATHGEVERVPMPGLHDVIWADREYLGWRDQQAHQRAYLVHWVDDRPVGILLRASEFSLQPGIAAMCSLCRITRRSHEISLFSAPLAGQAGRDGNTIGTYLCDDLACSHLIRILPPPHPMQPAPEEVLAARTNGLISRVQALTANVMRSA
ncbi:FBP domain-containing protein [Salinibacterium sp. G-O1]|uniref:FBP domain-containing protein n=1 Tax=Salinibacterium sp. G-O1 TaxID=3046208 RepID=UPI0024BBEAD3|nr:FBP domain-containing protein [Salinibacterium sp. G-O1]MDJ0335600.1 FBP domain-containing protein [Salinibacterium sp. G-O1]